MLTKNTTLISLNCWETFFGSVGAKAFARAISVNHTLKHLDISSQVTNKTIGFDADAGKALVDALIKNVSLTKVRMSENKFDWMSEGCIANVILHNHTLTSLSACDGAFREDYQKSEINGRLKSILDALTVNHRLRDLNIGVSWSNHREMVSKLIERNIRKDREAKLKIQTVVGDRLRDIKFSWD
jgi:Ran GTPase-activating protein (RanGAP) involved in mRNA processing and transport